VINLRSRFSACSTGMNVGIMLKPGGLLFKQNKKPPEHRVPRRPASNHPYSLVVIHCSASHTVYVGLIVPNPLLKVKGQISNLTNEIMFYLESADPFAFDLADHNRREGNSNLTIRIIDANMLDPFITGLRIVASV
jgi:hypothetical protein